MSDLVERLRVRRNPMLDGQRAEAADEIDRLNAQALELCAEISGLRRRLAEAERLLIDGSRIGMTVGDRANWMIETRDWLGSKRAASDSADEVQK